MGSRDQWEHQMTGEHLVDGLMIEIGTVVAFEHQRRSMPQEQLLQASGHGFSQRPLSHPGRELITGGEVLHLMQVQLVRPAQWVVTCFSSSPGVYSF